MALTSGFFNSKAGDRKYNAEQVGEIFDGILTDGIIPSYGQIFDVNTANNGMQITVGTGRAWFDHTWTKNDSIMILTVPMSDITRPRYDAVVLEINRSEGVRANSIKIVTGVPSINTTKPILLNTSEVKQYPLAYIYVPAAATTIKASNIENMVGREPTIFATGILQPVPIDDLWSQWDGEFHEWLARVKEDLGDLEGEAGGFLSQLEDLKDKVVYKSDKASSSEAKAGTNDTKWMTPSKTKEAINNQIENNIFKTNIIPFRSATSVPSFIAGGYETKSYYVDLNVGTVSLKVILRIIPKSSVSDKSIPKGSEIIITLPYSAPEIGDINLGNFNYISTNNLRTSHNTHLICTVSSNTFLFIYSTSGGAAIVPITINSSSSATVGAPYYIPTSKSNYSYVPYISTLSDGRIAVIGGNGNTVNDSIDLDISSIYIFESVNSITSPNAISTSGEYSRARIFGSVGNYFLGLYRGSGSNYFYNFSVIFFSAISSNQRKVVNISTPLSYATAAEIIATDPVTGYVYYQITGATGDDLSTSTTVYIRGYFTPNGTMTQQVYTKKWDENSSGTTLSRIGANENKKIYYLWDKDKKSIKALNFTNNYSISSETVLPDGMEAVVSYNRANYVFDKNIEWCSIFYAPLSNTDTGGSGMYQGLYNLTTHEVLYFTSIGFDHRNSASGRTTAVTLQVFPVNNWALIKMSASFVPDCLIPINIKDRIIYMIETG